VYAPTTGAAELLAGTYAGASAERWEGVSGANVLVGGSFRTDELQPPVQQQTELRIDSEKDVEKSSTIEDIYVFLSQRQAKYQRCPMHCLGFAANFLQLQSRKRLWLSRAAGLEDGRTLSIIYDTNGKIDDKAANFETRIQAASA
jgi:hypothetical protein